MQLRFLGSGGFVPTDRRETACALLRRDGEALLIDAGTGARRLIAEPSLLEGVERLHVVLTHFHLDHTIGLFYLPDLGPSVEVWGAGEALEATPMQELVRRLLGSPFAPRSFLGHFGGVRELGLEGAQIGSFRLQVRIQRRHANPTLALRFDDALAWCTDTAYDPENAAFARGVETLCHEAFHAADETDDPGHASAGEAARLAAAAEVERLVLIHVNPGLDDDGELLRFARPRFGATEVARDGAEL